MAAPSPPTTSRRRAACTQCHTTAGNYALYSVTGTHQGVTKCLTCHAPAVATTFANITIVSTPGNHIPIGTLDCNGSGCHTHDQRQHRRLQARQRQHLQPDAEVAGHTTVAAAVASCQTCHEAAPYLGMLAEHRDHGRRLAALSALDKGHPTTGRLQRLPHHEPDLHHQPDRQQHQACQSHPDDRGVRAVPHHRG